MSAVLRYFKLGRESSATAIRHVCQVGLLCGGMDRAAYNNTNLIRHKLKNKYPAQYSEFSVKHHRRENELAPQNS